MKPAYSTAQKFMHWLMATLILLMLCGGFFMGDVPNELKPTVYMLHKSFGVLILMLIPVRLIIRFSNPPHPVYRFNHFIHYIIIKLSVPVLYIMMTTIAFSGFYMVLKAGYSIDFFNLFSIKSLFETDLEIAKIAKYIHKNGVIIGLVIVSMHILAAFYHHFALKDDSLKSMLPLK
ncbi:MAG: cytochrome b [Proteobacteria bacterium]|nr:cytochrome b [Pseudomonadota bacterium]